MKNLFAIILSFLTFSLVAMEIEVQNQSWKLEYLNGYTLFSNGQDTVYDQEPGAPSLPLISHYFDLEGAADISEIDIKALGIKRIKLTKPLFPVQIPGAFSQIKPVFTEMNAEYYRKQYPEKWLYSSSSGGCGSINVGVIVLYGMRYNGETNEIEIPTSFEITVRTSGLYETDFVDNFATGLVLNNLEIISEDRQPKCYLLIAPMMFQNVLQPLQDWRYKQGYDVYFRTTGEIFKQYEGEDLAARIRACIADMQSSYGVDFVTLAGDTGHIPVRYAFAFDCEYGAHEGENELACDMYYSCLNGNWNADGDTFYGEDEDEVDLFPEVFVGRIPANEAAEITSYTEKLISYEKGLIADYERAGGMSMELWEGSSSEECQQYIYDNFFPDDYEIEFLYGTENTEINAFMMLSEGQNIVQHTGHAWMTVLTLENSGHIYSEDIEILTNSWSGIFYSIGCWSLAFDHESIGENFVRTADRNFLGYVGNSSYGWGAPSAPSFGFSEFYQRSFFEELFSEGIGRELGAVQALQKLPYLGYFEGASVFKWVGYELNLSGDAAARLFTSNPREMTLTANRYNDELHLQVMDGDNAISQAVIVSETERYFTGADGRAVLPYQTGEHFSYSIYAGNYRWQQLSNDDVQENLILELEQSPDMLRVNEEQVMILRVINPGENNFDFTFAAAAEPDVIEFSYDEDMIYTVGAGAMLNLEPVVIFYNDEHNLDNGSRINIFAQILEESSGEELTVAGFELALQSAAFKLVNVNWEENDFQPGESIPVQFDLLAEAGLSDIDAIYITYYTDGEYLEFEDLETVLYPGSINEGEILSDSNLLYIDPELPDSYYTTLKIKLSVTWSGDKCWSKEFAYCMGNAGLQMKEDFESDPGWTGDDSWQCVDNVAAGGTYSFSCRPTETGHYQILTPLLTWSPGTELSFNYRFRMPMYGEDGFMLKFIAEADTQNIVFLGSGGALRYDSARPMPEVYIEADWTNYSFDLEDILLEVPEPGTVYQLLFDFNFAEMIEGFNEYSEMPDTGIFIDDLLISQTEFCHENEDEPVFPLQPEIYPNPFFCGSERREAVIRFYQDKAQKVIIKLYDIRGRMVRKIADDHFSTGKQEILWDTTGLASGLYMIRLQQQNRIKFSKMLILR